MTVESAQFNQSGLIEAVIDGERWSVPDDMANRFRQEIAAWEAVGNTIAPYVAPPQRRLVPKSLVIARLTDAQLAAAIAAMTVRQQERWRAPDKPAIYADDPEAVALITGVGADPAAVLAAE